MSRILYMVLEIEVLLTKTSVETWHTKGGVTSLVSVA